MKYIRVYDKKYNINYPWMADIRLFEDLLEIEKKFRSRDAECIMDYLQSKDYSQAVNELFEGVDIDTDKNHCNPNNKLVPFLHYCVMTFPENERFYPFIYFVEKLSLASQSKIKCLNKYKRILINVNGGFMPWSSNFKKIESTVGNKFPQFSIDDVKISKWPEGKHFYATINGESIEMDGLNKWSTEPITMTAVKKWFKKGCKSKGD